MHTIVSTNGTCRLWDFSLLEERDEDDLVEAPKFSETGKDEIDLFEAPKVSEDEVDKNGLVKALKFSKDGSKLAIVRNRKLEMWNVEMWNDPLRSCILPKSRVMGNPQRYLFDDFQVAIQSSPIAIRIYNGTSLTCNINSYEDAGFPPEPTYDHIHILREIRVSYSLSRFVLL